MPTAVGSTRVAVAATLLFFLGGLEPAAQPSWRGVVIAPESRCAPYDADDYRYQLSVEAQIVAALGGVYGPYTGRWFSSPQETDIEHIVARAEAHDRRLGAREQKKGSEIYRDIPRYAGI